MPPGERIHKEDPVHDQGPREQQALPLEPSESVAADVTDRSLLELLLEHSDPELTASLGRLLEERSWRAGTVSGWSSFLR
jgi:FXSXX-COOH protein